MAKKNKGGFVYSTNPNFDYTENDESADTLPPAEQLLHLHRETKGRGGKAVVLIRNFVGQGDDLSQLGKMIKAHCGCGGSAKNGEIVIQGDQRDKIQAFLESKGYKTKRVGG